MSLVGRENGYTCKSCGGHIVTVDRDEGVTPFAIACRATPGCDGFMTSWFYPKGPRPARLPAPTFEWYTPGAKERLTLDSAMREHVDKGGLLIRPIRQTEGGQP